MALPLVSYIWEHTGIVQASYMWGPALSNLFTNWTLNKWASEWARACTHTHTCTPFGTLRCISPFLHSQTSGRKIDLFLSVFISSPKEPAAILLIPQKLLSCQKLHLRTCIEWVLDPAFSLLWYYLALFSLHDLCQKLLPDHALNADIVQSSLWASCLHPLTPGISSTSLTSALTFMHWHAAVCLWPTFFCYWSEAGKHLSIGELWLGYSHCNSNWTSSNKISSPLSPNVFLPCPIVSILLSDTTPSQASKAETRVSLRSSLSHLIDKYYWWVMFT